MNFAINSASNSINLSGHSNQQNLNCQNCNCAKSPNKQFNPIETAKEFCNLYYKEQSTKGCSGVLYLFDQNVFCNYNGKEYNGFYNVMTAMASEGISKTYYDKLYCTVLPINGNQISLQVTGNIQGYTFWGQYTAQYSFVETFILTAQNNIFVTSYSIKLI